ncbi:MAG: YdcF family protein [Gammaproteobacteria bacterium]
MTSPLEDNAFADARTLWTYNVLSEHPQAADICLGLGSHDLGVASRCAELYLGGYVGTLVFSGANSPTTVERFPKGEAVHYAEEAERLGVPATDILNETAARNTGDNFVLTKQLLKDKRIPVRSALLVTRPYQARRALATAQQLWPEVRFIPTPQKISFEDYTKIIGPKKLISMLVGDTQRVVEYPKLGFATKHDVPAAVVTATERLILAGYTSRLLEP